MSTELGRVRIGELARRTGVSPAVLRAWEQRYGVIDPDRSPGGTRLYSARDEARVRAMRAHIAAGLSPAEAARAARAPDAVGATRLVEGPAPVTHASDLDRGAGALRDALARLERKQAERALDLLLSALTFETVAVEVLLAVSLVRAAAILGDQTELALAAALAGLGTAAALDAASTLVRSDLLEQENPLAFSQTPGYP